MIVTVTILGADPGVSKRRGKNSCSLRGLVRDFTTFCIKKQFSNAISYVPRFAAGVGF